LWLSALALGIAFCAPPGAVNAESLRRGLARGFWPALRVQTGSLIGDMAWAAFAFSGAAFLVRNGPVRLILGLLGTLFLFRLTWVSLSAAGDNCGPAPSAGPSRGDLATGLFLSLANPWAVAFWLGVGGSLVATGSADPQLQHFALFLSGFLVGGLAWCLFISGLLAWGRRYVTAGFFRWVNLLCGLILGYFAAKLLWETLSLLM